LGEEVGLQAKPGEAWIPFYDVTYSDASHLTLMKYDQAVGLGFHAPPGGEILGDTLFFRLLGSDAYYWKKTMEQAVQLN
jgi:hypothetical protein